MHRLVDFEQVNGLYNRFHKDTPPIVFTLMGAHQRSEVVCGANHGIGCDH